MPECDANSRMHVAIFPGPTLTKVYDRKRRVIGEVATYAYIMSGSRYHVLWCEPTAKARKIMAQHMQALRVLR